MVKKMPGGGYGVAHCHGKEKGKFINKKRMSKKKATKIHQAIAISKHLKFKP